mgnify:CR=1 FL=1
MTHSIISLGKAFPLDSLQRAILARWFWQAGGQRFANPCPQLVRLFQWAILTHWFCYGQNQVVILATWFSTGLEALRKNDVLILTTWFSVTGRWISVPSFVRDWVLFGRCVTLNQVLILSTCSICNTFSIDFLPTGIAAIAGICTFGCEFFTAALAY